MRPRCGNKKKDASTCEGLKLPRIWHLAKILTFTSKFSIFISSKILKWSLKKAVKALWYLFKIDNGHFWTFENRTNISQMNFFDYKSIGFSLENEWLSLNTFFEPTYDFIARNSILCQNTIFEPIYDLRKFELEAKYDFRT